MTYRALKGQTTIEFAAVATVFVLILLAVIEFGFAQFQKTSFDYQISNMADELPSGWQSMDAKSVVKQVVAKASGISENDIDVDDAEIHLEDESKTVLNDDTALALGSELKTTAAKYLNVKATVTIKLGRGLGLLGQNGTEYRRTIDKSFTVEKRWEVA